MTTSQSDKAARFRALHEGPRAFVIANPWDAGSARVLAALGFQALATSSGAKAGVLGKRDGKVTRDESLANARMIVEATDLPVSADLEKCFGDAPAVVAETIRLAAGVGLVGGSVEDATGEKDRPLYDIGQATERVAAAAQAARALSFPFMLTARTESFLRGNPNLDDVIKRLQTFEKAGADVLMAPGLPDLAAVRAVCVAVIEARQFHGGHQGQVLHRRRARGGRRAPHQPGHVTLPLRDDEPRRGCARGEGQGDVRLHRPLDPDPRPRRVHAGLSTRCGGGARAARTYWRRRTATVIHLVRRRAGPDVSGIDGASGSFPARCCRRSRSRIDTIDDSAIGKPERRGRSYASLVGTNYVVDDSSRLVELDVQGG